MQVQTTQTEASGTTRNVTLTFEFEFYDNCLDLYYDHSLILYVTPPTSPSRPMIDRMPVRRVSRKLAQPEEGVNIVSMVVEER